MKGACMKAPGISEIYSQRVMYDLHKKKLERIREERKTQLTFDHNRISHIENFKQSKSKSFAYKFNEQNVEINRENMKLFGKLEKVKPFQRYTSHSAYEHQNHQKDVQVIAHPTPYIKKRQIETQKENARIFNKMRSLSSSLNKDRLLRDYAKSQQIKTRITRYANENNKIRLKSQKYFQLNQSGVSQASSQMQSRRTVASHYKKEEILKNKIDSADSTLLKIRKNRMPQTNSEADKDQIKKESGFFTTEPQKTRKIPQKKIYV